MLKLAQGVQGDLAEGQCSPSPLPSPRQRVRWLVCGDAFADDVAGEVDGAGALGGAGFRRPSLATPHQTVGLRRHPVASLKALLKWVALLKPQEKAISVMDFQAQAVADFAYVLGLGEAIAG